MKRRQFLRAGAAAGASVTSGLWLTACGGGGGESVAAGNRYQQTNLVASSAAYNPQIVEPLMVNGWGIAIRPAGAGGHFWVTASGTSLEYVGDVNGTPLFTDSLDVVTLPPSAGNVGAGNGVVFNTGTHFVITQDHPNGPITAPAKFLFVSDNGVLSAWTERLVSPGVYDRPVDAVTVLDYGADGSSFFGLALSPANDELYVVDFGANPLPTLRVIDASLHELAIGSRFPNPFIGAGGFKVGDLVPFNVQTLTYGSTSSVFINYVNTSEDPGHPGQLLPAVESSGRGRGRLVEYTPAGDLVAIWDDRGTLNGPWGAVIAPADFGPFSNQLIVGNFSDGTLVGFDTTNKRATEYLRDANGNVLKIQGLWGLLFGNGASLGDANAMYFAAGPEDETAGLFGSLRHIA